MDDDFPATVFRGQGVLAGIERETVFRMRYVNQMVGTGQLAASAVAWAFFVMLLAPGSAVGGPREKREAPPALVEVSAVLEKMVVTRVELVGTAEPWSER
ncbi:MAG: hypothetical protein KKG10_15210, partial [Proteobacteria bacterium]|nr:hypothetical protein [Pseudomonadota bacterium]